MERTILRRSSPVPTKERKSVQAIDIRRDSMPDLNRLHANSAVSSQLTPPMTPSNANEGFRVPTTSLFHNYLRAFHEFDPHANSAGDDEAASITVPINQGDLILVHSIHANGWADGTLLTSGNRGWLPTNYCEPYDHPYIRNLLSAMTQFWDLLGGDEDANLSTILRQDYVKGLIAGVRFLLENAQCMHRDATLVTRNVGIRRMRKGLLADLSTLVQKAKEMQQAASEAYAGEVVPILLEELVSKACKVVMRAVKFVDVWEQETSNDQIDLQDLSTAPYTPPAEVERLAVDTKACPQTPGVRPPDSAKEFPQPHVSSQPRHSVEEHHPSDENSTDEQQTRPSLESKRAVTTHRLSLVKTETDRHSALASEQLASAHDVCISHIGAFIGHHLQSRSPTELVTVTERLATACKALLAIVEEVAARDCNRDVAVQHARNQFQAKLADLIRSTKEVFTFSDLPDDEFVMLPQQSSHLILVGTNLIRTASECVSKTRTLIEQTGDFALQQETNTPKHGNQDPLSNSPSKRLSIDAKQPSSPPKPSLTKTLPPPPPLRPRAQTAVSGSHPQKSLTAKSDQASAGATAWQGKHGASASAPWKHSSQVPGQLEGSLRSPRLEKGHTNRAARQDSVGISVTDSFDTYQSSMRDSEISVVSPTSTRATTPDQMKDPNHLDPSLLNSFASLSSIRSVATDLSSDAEVQLLQKTFVHELMVNKEGQVVGGTLPALVEQLTMQESTPDPQFTTAFYLTFRLFTTPRQLAQTLIERFDYIADNQIAATPVRLRIFNVFKGWLETYWNAEADKDALGDIRYFAVHKLKHQMPSIADRLLELTRRVSAAYSNGTLNSPLVSSVGKSSTSLGTLYERDCSTPDTLTSKSQVNALRMALSGTQTCCITDLDALEIARQLTLITSKLFCEIKPEELLALDWNKNRNKTSHVRRISTLNTQLAYMVSDTILLPEDPKRRALIIKQWVKIATHCMELRNYESLMGIMGSLNTTMVLRLKRTWDLVSKKTRARLDELNAIVDLSRNYKSLRSKVETPIAPCLPFLGIYLQDLTFTDAGNPNEKELPGSATPAGVPVTVINFDKYVRMARITSHVQKFQVPYRLHAVREMQDWLEASLKKMGDDQSEAIAKFHRRSKTLEPALPDNSGSRIIERKQSDEITSTSAGAAAPGIVPHTERPRTAGSRSDGTKSFNSFLRSNTFGFKSAATAAVAVPASPTSIDSGDPRHALHQAS